MSDYKVVNPATGETLAEYPLTTDAELEQAIAAAYQAAKGWAHTSSVAERAALLRRVAELHRERRDDLAATIVREMGKPLSAAVGEVDFAADITEFYADNAEKIMADQPIDILAEGTAVIRRSPLGVLLGIMPWNFPYYQVARFAAPNLRSATRSCSSTPRSAPSPRRRSRRSTATPGSPMARTRTCTSRTTSPPR
jgi:succinate-semialdehyde dehydrogenase/glutarate-semialdehyde dehydrogenase